MPAPNCPSSSSIGDYAARTVHSSPCAIRASVILTLSAGFPVVGNSSIALLFQRSAVNSERISRRFPKSVCTRHVSAPTWRRVYAAPFWPDLWCHLRVLVACSHPVIMTHPRDPMPVNRLGAGGKGHCSIRSD